MTSIKQQARVMAAVMDTLQPYDPRAEEAAIAAWRALDTFTSMEAAQLRQNRRALIEMQDMLRRALEASK